MTDTKLAKDLERIANAMAHGSCIWPAGVERDMAALARVTAAIEHLERGAVALRSLIAAVPIRHMGGEQNVLLVHQWDEADRALGAK